MPIALESPVEPSRRSTVTSVTSLARGLVEQALARLDLDDREEALTILEAAVGLLK